MKITPIKSRMNLKELKKREALIPSILDRVFLICKEDKNFLIKREIKDIEKQLNILNLKIKKQDGLLEQAQNMKHDFNSRIVAIDEDSFRNKVSLLETLGSEL